MANLSSLPGEVIDAICDYLRTPGIQNLRFVDKSLNAKASHAFFSRKFGTVQFMITRNSLKVLVERSTDSRFRTAVKELQLCLITFPPQSKRELDRNLSSSEQKELHEIETELISEGVAKLAFDLDARADATYDPLPPVHPRIAQFETRAKQKRRRLYSTIMHDQNTLRTKGLDVEMLAEALRNLPALTDITTVDRYQNLNPPFGAKAIFRQLKGIHPRPAAMFKPEHRNHYPYPWHVHQDEVRNIFRNYCMHSIGVVLGAILKSGFQLQGTLSLAGVPHELLFSKTPTRRRLYPTATPSKTFALSQIPELNLAKLTGLNLSMYGYPEEDIRLLGIQPQDCLRWLKQFIPLMPNLKSLSITGAYTRHEKSLLRPLADGQLRIPNLQTLELKCQCFSMEHLQLVLLKHATTLRSLKLWECTTTAQTFIGLFQALSQLSHITLVDISYAQYKRWENSSMTRLRGHGTAEFRIQAATSSEFQLTLASMYTVFAGTKA